MSTVTKPITVDEYDRMVESGSIGEDDQVELWDGAVVPKMPKNPPHRVGTRKTLEALARVLPAGWYADKEEAVVVGPRSKPEPDVAVLRVALKEVRLFARSDGRRLLPDRGGRGQ
jgi:Uma2 family endonuclease